MYAFAANSSHFAKDWWHVAFCNFSPLFQIDEIKRFELMAAHGRLAKNNELFLWRRCPPPNWQHDWPPKLYQSVCCGWCKVLYHLLEYTVSQAGRAWLAFMDRSRIPLQKQALRKVFKIIPKTPQKPSETSPKALQKQALQNIYAESWKAGSPKSSPKAPRKRAFWELSESRLTFVESPSKASWLSFKVLSKQADFCWKPYESLSKSA